MQKIQRYHLVRIFVDTLVLSGYVVCGRPLNQFLTFFFKKGARVTVLRYNVRGALEPPINPISEPHTPIKALSLTQFLNAKNTKTIDVGKLFFAFSTLNVKTILLYIFKVFITYSCGFCFLYLFTSLFHFWIFYLCFCWLVTNFVSLSKILYLLSTSIWGNSILTFFCLSWK